MQRDKLLQAAQASAQTAAALLLASLLVFVRPITFALACLAGVFVVLLRLLLCTNGHVGTQLMASATMLGAVAAAVVAAGCVASISLQAPSDAGRLAALAALASPGFALFALPRVHSEAFVLFIQGTNGLMAFGISAVLALFAPSAAVLWRGLGNVLLAFVAAALANSAAALLVLPSLAGSDAQECVLSVLRKAGRSCSLCISLLLAPAAESSGGAAGGGGGGLQQQQQPHWQSGASDLVLRDASSSSSSSSSRCSSRGGDSCTLRDPQVAHSSGAASPAHPAHAASLQLAHASSILEEGLTELPPPAQLQLMLHATVPGEWGFRSFVAADARTAAADADAAAAAAAAHADEQALQAADAASAAAGSGGAAQQQQVGAQRQHSSQEHHSHTLARVEHGVDTIRPLLAAAKALHNAVAVEQLAAVRLMCGAGPRGVVAGVGSWVLLVAALEEFVTRIAALEGMLEGGRDQASLASLHAYRDLSSTCATIFAQAAAMCSSLASALSALVQQQDAAQPCWGCAGSCGCCCSGGSDSGGVLLGICWHASRAQLRHVLRTEMGSYFAGLAAADKARPFVVDPARRIVGLLFLCTLAEAVVDAAQQLQAAGQAVVYDTQPACIAAVAAAAVAPADAVAVVVRRQQPAVAAKGGGGSSGGSGSGRARWPLQHVLSLCSGGGSSKGQADAGPSGGALLLEQLLMLATWRQLRTALGKLPVQLSSWQGVWQLLHSRRWQAGFKAWLAAMLALVVAMLLSRFWPSLPASIIMFGFIAVVFTMRERVESSIEMHAVGASIGLGAMQHAALASCPWGLCALLVGLAALLAPVAVLTQLRLMVVLGLLTLNSTVLCQYAPGATGSIGYFLGRIVSITGGAAFAMLLNRLLLPWSRNSWALEQMADALGLAVDAAAGMYAREHDHMAALAAATTAGQGSSSGRSAHGGDKDAKSSGRRDQGQQQQQQQQHVAVSMPPPAAGSAGGAAAAPAAPAYKQQLGQLQARLLPVQASLQRDTWLRWRSGVLAVPPVVPLMLAACQQLLDALAALSVTLERPFAPAAADQQQQGAAGAAGGGVAAANGGGSVRAGVGPGLSVEPPGDRALASAMLCYDDLVAPLHGDVMHLLGELRCLVLAVQQAVRQRGSLAAKQQLQAKVHALHQLRLAVHTRFILLRNKRHRKLHDLLGHPHQAPPLPQAGTAGSHHPQPQPPPAPLLLPANSSAWRSSVATVGYMACVFALRRVMNRATAVARCIADE